MNCERYVLTKSLDILIFSGFFLKFKPKLSKIDLKVDINCFDIKYKFNEKNPLDDEIIIDFEIILNNHFYLDDYFILKFFHDVYELALLRTMCIEHIKHVFSNPKNEIFQNINLKFKNSYRFEVLNYYEHDVLTTNDIEFLLNRFKKFEKYYKKQILQYAMENDLKIEVNNKSYYLKYAIIKENLNYIYKRLIIEPLEKIIKIKKGVK